MVQCDSFWKGPKSADKCQQNTNAARILLNCSITYYKIFKNLPGSF